MLDWLSVMDSCGTAERAWLPREITPSIQSFLWPLYTGMLSLSVLLPFPLWSSLAMLLAWCFMILLKAPILIFYITFQLYSQSFSRCTNSFNQLVFTFYFVGNINLHEFSLFLDRRFQNLIIKKKEKKI